MSCSPFAANSRAEASRTSHELRLGISHEPDSMVQHTPEVAAAIEQVLPTRAAAEMLTKWPQARGVDYRGVQTVASLGAATMSYLNE